MTRSPKSRVAFAISGVALVTLLACAVSIAVRAQDARLSQAATIYGEGGTHPVPSDTGARGDDVVRVMTWNIRYDNADDGVHAWEKRRDALLSYVLSRKPDILYIQEGLNGQVAFLKEGLRGYDMRGVGRDDGNTGVRGTKRIVPLLVRTNAGIRLQTVFFVVGHHQQHSNGGRREERWSGTNLSWKGSKEVW